MTVNWAQPLERMSNGELKAAYREVRADGFFPKLAARLYALVNERGLNMSTNDDR